MAGSMAVRIICTCLSRPHRTAPYHTSPRRWASLQVLGDGSSLGTFTSSGTTLDFENWTLNAVDVSTIKLVARGLGYNDWLSITEARTRLRPRPEIRACNAASTSFPSSERICSNNSKLYNHVRLLL